MAGIVLRIGVSVTAGGVLAAAAALRLAQVRPTWQKSSVSSRIGLFSLTLVADSRARLIDEDIFKRRVLVYGAGAMRPGSARLRRRADQRGFKLIAFVPVAR